MFSDYIENVYYDTATDATVFEFIDSTFNDMAAFAFKGNLTEKYHAGDVLNLRFKVVEYEHDDNVVFEELDYRNEYYKTGSFPAIENYLVE